MMLAGDALRVRRCWRINHLFLPSSLPPILPLASLLPLLLSSSPTNCVLLDLQDSSVRRRKKGRDERRQKAGRREKENDEMVAEK